MAPGWSNSWGQVGLGGDVRREEERKTCVSWSYRSCCVSHIKTGDRCVHCCECMYTLCTSVSLSICMGECVYSFRPMGGPTTIASFNSISDPVRHRRISCLEQKTFFNQFLVLSKVSSWPGVSVDPMAHTL